MKLKTVKRSFALIILIIGAIVSLVPFIWLIRSSLMTSTEIFEFPPKLLPEKFQWSNYKDIFSIINFGLYLKNTLFIMIPVIIGTIITCCMCGYGFARLRFPGRNMWFGMILATMMLPGAVTLIPTFLMWSKLGGINTFWPLIVPAFFGGGGFFIFLMRQFFMNIPRELDESALMDGANHFQIFTKILLPLVKPPILVVGFFTFMGVWNDFFGPLIFLNDESKYTLALGLLQLKGSYSSDWNLMMAASAVMVIPAIIIFFIGQRHFIEGISLTGIKG
ncbi:MAG: carbohydrate ABC transporter permease [Heyndrickxia sp.]